MTPNEPVCVSIHQAAKSMLALSISVIPAVNKMPAVKAWNPFRQKRMEVSQVESFFNGSPEIAVLGGGASGGLEIIDIDLKYDDSGTLFEDFSHLVSDADETLWNTLVMQHTRGGGVHILYRCAVVEGNKKLASRPASEAERAKNPDERVKVLIETRGEGGYVIAAPSPGYRLFSGHDFGQIPTITSEQRELLFAAARSMNQYVPQGAATGQAVLPSVAGFSKRESEEWEITPGDDFDARGDVVALLCEHGWSIVMERGEKVWLKRPGDSTAAHSANWNVIAGRFWCWSTSTQFEPETVYKPYAVYAWLKHNGNFSEAIKALVTLGYGKKREPVPFAPPQPGEKPQSAPDIKQVQKWILEDERGMALLFSALRGHEYVYDNTYKQWRNYRNGVWKTDEENRLYGKFADYMKPSVLKVLEKISKQALESKTKEKTEKLEALRKRVTAAGKSLNNAMPVQRVLSYCRSFLSTTTEHLDTHPLLFNMRNGTYDFNTASFRQHDPKDLLSKKSHHFYKPDARCPAWMDFLDTVFQQNTELISFVQRAVGYSLTGLSDMQALLFCHGGGGNGKSVFFAVLNSLIGDYYTNIPIDLMLSKERSATDEYQLATMRGARCVVASEIPSGKRLNEAQVKDMTGSDMINARLPYGKPFSFAPSHTLWMFGNHKPVISGTDFGIWRRINLIPFLYSVPPEKRRDTTAMMKEFENEMSGIFNWAAQGFRDYLKIGLSPPSIVLDATEEYKQDSNNFMQFMEEKCLKTTGNVQCKILFKSYIDWCQDQGEKPKFARTKQMNDFLKSSGFEPKNAAGNVVCVFGLMLKP